RHIGNSGGIPGGHASPLGEDWRQFCHFLQSSSHKGMLILGYDFSAFLALQGHRRNFILEPARLDGPFGLLLGAQGELVLLVAADLVLFVQNFACLTLLSLALWHG